MTIAYRLGLAAILCAAGAGAYAQTQAAGPTEAIIESWPKDLQTQARALIERYGKPGASDANALVWLDNGPWRKTVLHREGFTRPMMGQDRDHLEQVVSYQVPENKVAEIQRFDKRIEVNRATDEMSSRADTESMNFLALNLADDIIRGDRTAQAARMFYRKVKMLEKAGKSSPYLEGLLFAKRGETTKEPAEAEDEGTMSPDKDRKTEDADEASPAATEEGAEGTGTDESGTAVPKKSGRSENPPVYDDVPKR